MIPQDVPRPAALLFDFDGVLINSLPVMQLAFSAALQEVYPSKRMPHTALFKAYRTHLGMGFPQIMRNLDLSPDMFAPFRKHSRILAPYVRLYDDAIDLLDWAQSQGLPIGIATGKDYERTIELLDQLGIRHYFAAVYSSDNVPRPKPAPDMVQRFASETGIAISRILMIGDAAADIHCGQAAGCPTAAAAWGYTERATLTALRPTLIFDTPQDAQTQLQNLLLPEMLSK
ncbi:HAD-IA family hydrolase [Yoonia sp. BS5-3]|uniref:phosphoglycolate phosphatase n=1 Tax=Yoonia phaeophyticola TaxID=3137369 RepID=A0ABZ2V626_9RHOB